MKYVLILLSFGFLTYMSWRLLLRYLLRLVQGFLGVHGMQGRAGQTQQNQPQSMVCCCRCNIHIPQHEAFCHAGRLYCCAAHAHMADSAPSQTSTSKASSQP